MGAVGIAVTYFFVPSLTGDDMAIEDERFRAYLVRNGWRGSMGEEDLKDNADAGIPGRLVAESEDESGKT